MREQLWTAVALLVLGSGSASEAADLALTATKTSTISDGKGNSRVLIDVAGVDALQEEWVSTATLTVALMGATVTQDQRITVLR